MGVYWLTVRLTSPCVKGFVSGQIFRLAILRAAELSPFFFSPVMPIKEECLLENEAQMGE